MFDANLAYHRNFRGREKKKKKEEFCGCYLGKRNLRNIPALKALAICASITAHTTQVISPSSAGIGTTAYAISVLTPRFTAPDVAL